MWNLSLDFTLVYSEQWISIFNCAIVKNDAMNKKCSVYNNAKRIWSGIHHTAAKKIKEINRFDQRSLYQMWFSVIRNASVYSLLPVVTNHENERQATLLPAAI